MIVVSVSAETEMMGSGLRMAGFNTLGHQNLWRLCVEGAGDRAVGKLRYFASALIAAVSRTSAGVFELVRGGGSR